MAAINPVVTLVGEHTKHIKWTVPNADTFVAYGGQELADYADRVIQVSTVATGATIVLNGSNELDGSNAFGLSAADSTAISKNAAPSGEQILENTLWIQPAHSGGSGGTSTVIILARRSRSGVGV